MLSPEVLWVPWALCATSKAATSLVHSLNHDARHIITRALLQGELAQAVGAFLYLGMLLDEAEKLCVGDGAVEAVGAEQELVARLDFHHFDLGAFADLFAAEVFPEHVAKAMLLRLGGRDRLVLHKRLGKGVVDG